jgi:hypothetical protein
VGGYRQTAGILYRRALSSSHIASPGNISSTN